MKTNDFSNIKLVNSLDENISIIKNIFINDRTLIYIESFYSVHLQVLDV